MSTYGSVEIARLEKKKKKEEDDCLASRTVYM